MSEVCPRGVDRLYVCTVSRSHCKICIHTSSPNGGSGTNFAQRAQAPDRRRLPGGVDHGVHHARPRPRIVPCPGPPMRQPRPRRGGCASSQARTPPGTHAATAHGNIKFVPGAPSDEDAACARGLTALTKLQKRAAQQLLAGLNDSSTAGFVPIPSCAFYRSQQSSRPCSRFFVGGPSSKAHSASRLRHGWIFFQSSFFS